MSIERLTHSQRDWEHAAAGVLRKGGRLGPDDPDTDVWRKLARTTLDPVTVPPLGLSTPSRFVPRVEGRGARDWDIRALLADPQTSAANALGELEGGATSLWLRLGPTGIPVDLLGTALDGVLLDVAPVVLDAPEDPVTAAMAFARLLTAADVDPAEGTSLGADPIGAGADCDRVVPQIAELASRLDVVGFTADGTRVHDRGASDAQELGYATAVATAYLRRLVDLGLSVEEAADLIEFRYAATDQQFPTIAKLRASEQLWSRVLQLSGFKAAIPGVSARSHVHAVTSRPMMTRRDPWVNMLRVTVAAFAAGVAGADAVTVLPFDAALGLPDSFSRRIARNVSSLLISESHLARVADPAAGAFAVEQLTEDLAEAGWEEFTLLDETGVVAALTDGSLDARIEQVCAARTERVAHRRTPITGVSEFPNLGEALPQRSPHPDGAWQVEPYDAAFEQLRDNPPAAKVFIATLGPIAAHTARATFATNLFAAGGIAVDTAGATGGVDEVIAAYDGQQVVCLAGTDAAYEQSAATTIAALREAGAAYVIIAGKPGELPVDDSCSAGGDAVAFLHRVRERLES